MKSFIQRSGLAALAMAALIPCLAYGHDGPVHKKITESAFGVATGLQSFLIENEVPTTLTALPRHCAGMASPLGWLKNGSYFEDEETYSGITLRPVNHFYTVTTSRIPGQVIGITGSPKGLLIC
jgi:hypothetical protein